MKKTAPTVGWQLDRLKSELKDADLTIVDPGQTGSLWASLIEFQALAMGPVSFVANLRPSSVVSFMSSLDPGLWAVQAHAGNGIVRAHAVGDWAGEGALDRQIAKLRGTARADGGNLILSRCPVDLKRVLGVWGEPRADWAIGERVKAALDPNHAMNPGRFVGRI